jgi:hypothetical protein
MKVTEWRKVIDSIKTFASTRQKAEGPESLVGVQATDGVVKLIAGSDVAAIIVTLDDVKADEGRYGFAIPARMLIESAGVLPTKDEVSISVSKGLLTIHASGGGRLDLKAIGNLSTAGFPKKPKVFSATGAVVSQQWGQMTRLFGDILDKYKVLNHINLKVIGDEMSIVSSSINYDRYASVKVVKESGDDCSFFPVNQFWNGLKALTDDGKMMAGPEGFLATDGRVEVFSNTVHFSEDWGLPILEPMGSGTSFTMKRTDLISAESHSLWMRA